MVGASAVARVEAARHDPEVAAAPAGGLLKSDPALLAYFSQRVTDAGGLPPADWCADPRVQHPHVTDVPAQFTVGEEFLVAWTRLLLRRLGYAAPLVPVCLVLFGLLASLAAVGVFGLARELTGSWTWAGFAALLWALLPANYRTVAFVLVREDLSFPLLAIALWLVARAARVRTLDAWIGAGLALATALATWHAMGFFVAVLLVAPCLWLLRTGESVLALPRAPWVLLLPAIAALLVPALRTANAIGSLPALLAAGLLAAALAERRGARRESRLLAFVGGAVAVVLLAATLRVLHGVPGAYAHVSDVLLAKVRTLGQKPADPSGVPFDARLLWQGPFETLAPAAFPWYLGWTLLFVGGAAALGWRWWRRPPGPELAPCARRRAVGEALLVAAVLLSLPAAWLVQRVVILPGLLAPVLAAVVLARVPRRSLALGLAALALAAQAFVTVPWLMSFRSVWYLPPGRQQELAALVDWVGANVPSDEPIVTDFMNGPALLLGCGNPIALQPKYETDASRRAAEQFLVTFFHDSPAQLVQVVRERFHARYFLIDRYTLGVLSRWTAGLPEGAPDPPGSAADLFLSQDPAVLEHVDGLTLVYRSPATIVQSNGEPYDLFRLYRIDG